MGGHNSKDNKTQLSLSEPKPAMDTTTQLQTTDSTTEPGPAWSALLGESNWTGLLDPLDLHLRTLILRCGDFCQGTYDAFNNDANSKYAGSSRYGHANFFDKVMLQDAANYEIASFLYATAQVSVPEAFLLHSMSRESWDRESNWIGYVAVTTDEFSKSIGRREIYVAWRGTTRNYEWINVLGAELVSAEQLLNPENNNTVNKDVKQTTEGEGGTSSSSDDEEEDKIPKVMRGWLSMYTSDDSKSSFTKLSARVQLVTKINELREKYKGENLSIALTGHSLGASLAIVSAFDLVENGVSDIPVAAFVFGSPQVGNKAFKTRISNHPNLKIMHIKNTIDVIPHYPGRILGYRYIGTEVVIDTRKSPYLKDSKEMGDWHNLQAMLHIVAGWNGQEGEFELKVKRSVALVNKSCDFLKPECSVPAMWWVEKNKGMVRDESGEWVQAPPADEDLPVPEY
ncbi:phospholipase A1-IIdelta [Argentina anserina]|uniref:phospholipase A1-IIdelta n=1 Tax=Argentina anserina TaxID=57926 RepID=UPI0021765B13|nr:phospholipase A1-IIdelta [Potentilla anserina]